MCRWGARVLLVAGLVWMQALATIVIKDMSGTESAVLGTNTTTIQCDYEFEDEAGVEVKWFYNSDVQIFLWVPNRNTPMPMGPFSNLLDVTNNSIRFKDMTKNLTGYYTCKVTSDFNESSVTQMMVPYQPPKKVEFFPEESSETLICSAYELFPQPNITIIVNYGSDGNETKILHEEEEEESIVDTEDAFYNVTKTIKYDSKAIRGSAQFVCSIVIPNTNYNNTLTLNYEKSGNESTTTEPPDYYEYTTIPAETTISSATINTTTINSATTGQFGAPCSDLSGWLLIVAFLLQQF